MTRADAVGARHAEVPVRDGHEALYDRTIDILERLIAFDTTSHRSNLELIDYVRELLAGNGIEATVLPDEGGDKANLVATAAPAGAGGRGIILSGHTDVVPVDGQRWTTDPFRLSLSEEYATGRGVADMKGFIACALAVLTSVDRSALRVPLSLLLTHDEEVGCVGARNLVPTMRTWAETAVGCVVGEPTGLRIVVGHKGKQNHRLRVTGEAKHAALAPGVANAIVAMARLTTVADDLNDRFRSAGPHDDRFDIGHSWINIGRVGGGVKPNIVPEHCEAELEIRVVPGHDCALIAAELAAAADEVLAGMRRHTPASAIELVRLSDTPSFVIEQDHPFVTSMAAAFGQTEAPRFVPFGTEAGLIWGMADIPAVVCGPGDIAQAHTADESVPLEHLRRCLAQLTSLPVR